MKLNTEISDALRQEGQFRELVRLVQEARKKAGLEVGQRAKMTLSTTDKTWREVFEAKSEVLQKAAGLSALEIVSDSEGLEQLGSEPIFIRLEQT